MVWIASIQIIYWCSLEFTKGVLLAQVDFLPHSSLMSVLLIEMTYPAIQVVATIIAYMVILYMRSATRMTASSLQIIGLGYIVLLSCCFHIDIDHCNGCNSINKQFHSPHGSQVSINYSTCSSLHHHCSK